MHARPMTAMDRLIAKRLRVRRKLLGIPARDMAFVSGMSIERYRRIEAAQEPIASDQLQEFAFLLDVPVPYFFQQL